MVIACGFHCMLSVFFLCVLIARAHIFGSMYDAPVLTVQLDFNTDCNSDCIGCVKVQCGIKYADRWYV